MASSWKPTAFKDVDMPVVSVPQLPGSLDKCITCRSKANRKLPVSEITVARGRKSWYRSCCPCIAAPSPLPCRLRPRPFRPKSRPPSAAVARHAGAHRPGSDPHPRGASLRLPAGGCAPSPGEILAGSVARRQVPHGLDGRRGSRSPPSARRVHPP